MLHFDRQLVYNSREGRSSDDIMPEWVWKSAVCIAIGLLLFAPCLWARRRSMRSDGFGEGELRPSMEDSFLMRTLMILLYGCIIFCVMIMESFMDLQMYLAVGILTALGLMGTVWFVVNYLWRASIQDGAISVYAPFLPVRTIRFSEITSAKNTTKGLACFIGKKKVLFLERDIVGLEKVYQMMRESGKLEKTPYRESFIILKEKRSRITSGVLALSCCAFFCIYLLQKWEPVVPEGIVTALLLVVFFGTTFAGEMLWKIELSYKALSYRNSVGFKKEYAVSQITGVRKTKSSQGAIYEEITLFSGGKKVTRIYDSYCNYSQMVSWLQMNDILKESE